MSDFSMTIGGRSGESGGTFGVINPATGDVFAQAPQCTREQLDAAMQSAAEAYKSWRRDDARRRQALQDCAAAISNHVAELAPILTQEQGKPLTKAVEEIMGTSFWFQYTSTLELPVEVLADSPESRIEVRRRPLGVVAAITPWNFPLILASWKIAPALLAGNTVVLKPSPFTPLSTLSSARSSAKCFPPGCSTSSPAATSSAPG
jgi:acyl-CoA reductase-like NAD-dependent aldehyde dehydrogenase